VRYRKTRSLLSLLCKKVVKSDCRILNVLFEENCGRFNIANIDGRKDRTMLTLGAAAIVAKRNKQSNIAIDPVIELIDERKELRPPAWRQYRGMKSPVHLAPFINRLRLL